MRLEKILAAHALRNPGRAALICGPDRVSYAELHASIRRAACGLAALGVRPGDRVLLYLPNGIEFVQLMYAAFSLGATVVPVNPRLTANEVAHILRDCLPSAAACHAGARDALRPGLARVPGCRAIVAGGAVGAETALEQLTSGSAAEPVQALPVPPDAEDCMILYTSGTTGAPKGAVLTHANMILQNIYMHGIGWGLSADDIFLVITPLAHRAGIARLFDALGLGGTLVVVEKFEPAAALELIARERVSVAGLVPTVLRMMLPDIRRAPERMATLRSIIVATERFPVPLKREIAALLPQVQLLSVFGMTEASVTTQSHAEQFSHPDSVGRPFPGIEVRIVGDAGRDVPDGEVGELWVRSGIPGRFGVMKGYFNRPEETAAALEGGWYHTGDLGRRDAEGYLYVVDRKKDMVLSGGYNIYSREVEQALESHADVAEAAVVGVSDEVYGEAVAAFVVPRRVAHASAAELIEHCRTKLASYKKPRHLFFVDALPKNSVGKVLKTELRQITGEAGGLKPRAGQTEDEPA